MYEGLAVLVAVVDGGNLDAGMAGDHFLYISPRTGSTLSTAINDGGFLHVLRVFVPRPRQRRRLPGVRRRHCEVNPHSGVVPKRIMVATDFHLTATR